MVLAASGHGVAPGTKALIRAGLLSPSACHRFAAGTVEGIAWNNGIAVAEMIRYGRPGPFASKPSCYAGYQRCVMCDLGASVHHVRYHPASRNPRKGGLRDDNASCPAACHLPRA
jgi:hypothetical protein